MRFTTLPLLALVTVVSATASREIPKLIARGTTGDSTCGTNMCVSATVNGPTVDYVLSSTGKAQPGWMAVGFGSHMAGSPMVIMWSNSDGTITLSQRSASSEVQPKLDSNPPRVASLLTNLSSTTGDIKYAFTIDANNETSQDIIYSFGAINPDSSATDATLRKHIDFGIATLDLTKDSASTSDSPADNKSTLLPFERLIVAHAIFCVVGFLLFLPAGALLARYLRVVSPRWFTGHWISQLALAGPLIVVGVALGIRSVVSSGSRQLDTTHKRLGIALFLLYVLQCALGSLVHWMKPKNSRTRQPQNYVHAVVGLLIIALAFYQVRTGYHSQWPKSTGRGPLPRGVNIVWYVWVVLIPVIYAMGLALLPKQLRQEKGLKVQHVNDSDTDQSDMQQITL